MPLVTQIVTKPNNWTYAHAIWLFRSQKTLAIRKLNKKTSKPYPAETWFSTKRWVAAMARSLETSINGENASVLGFTRTFVGGDQIRQLTKQTPPLITILTMWPSLALARLVSYAPRLPEWLVHCLWHHNGAVIFPLSTWYWSSHVAAYQQARLLALSCAVLINGGGPIF